MRLNFYKLTIHNFLSYGDAEIDLSNRNYCLVKGINKCPLDNAVSNGSGKSSWISAICWCLTGETVQGITSGIKNIYIDEPKCSVTLEFSVDGDSYIVTRIKEPSSDMKIIRNGVDISGKGIKESQLILAQYLPDLNRNLLCSVILLGQGLPSRFTNNSPSGRKGVLEELSKSDFMIEDIKERISSRLTTLNDKLRNIETDGVKVTVYLNTLSSQLEDANNKLVKLRGDDYDTLISDTDTRVKELQTSMINCNALSLLEDKTISDLYSKKSDLTSSYTEKASTVREKYSKMSSDYDIDLADRRNTINNLKDEITKLDSIKDVCPTCHRPFEGVVKPDTTEMKSKLSSLCESYDAKVSDKKSVITTPMNEELTAIRNEMNTEIGKVDDLLKKETVNKIELGKQYASLSEEYTKENSALSTYRTLRDTKNKEIEDTLAKIKSLQSDIEIKEKEFNSLSDDKQLTQKHLEVVKQMDTLVKRDFRGFLLLDIIKYIDTKAKEYCMDVFGTDCLSFELDGNNIDIEYNGKDFSLLSGGEQQKVNIIIQFAIRSMLERCLDFHSNILVLDEVYDNLDSTGVNNINNLIATKLNDIESVFIISHHADELQLPTDSEIVITKDANGISSIL